MNEKHVVGVAVIVLLTLFLAHTVLPPNVKNYLGLN